MQEQITEPNRLPSVLPESVRLSWTSEAARETWASRFQRVIRAWIKVELLASAFGVRKCALITISEQELREVQELSQSWNLTALKLEDAGVANQRAAKPADAGLPPGTNIRYVVGVRQDALDFQAAWPEQDTDKIGKLLGYPACCRIRFRERQMSGHLIDHTWAMAVDSAANTNGVIEICPPRSSLGNVLLRLAGIRAVPHLPCRMDCENTLELGHRFLDVARKLEFHDEAIWLQQMLSWPLEWSALHGIAEIRTPIFKIVTRTEMAGKNNIVRWIGESYPQEGAQGLRFPYSRSQRPGVSESPAFLRGLVNFGPSTLNR